MINDLTSKYDDYYIKLQPERKPNINVLKTSTQNANNDFTIVTLKESDKYYWKQWLHH